MNNTLYDTYLPSWFPDQAPHSDIPFSIREETKKTRAGKELVPGSLCVTSHDRL